MLSSRNKELVLDANEYFFDRDPRVFEVILNIDGRQVSNGIGSNKKEAEQNASFNAIYRIEAGDVFGNITIPD